MVGYNYDTWLHWYVSDSCNLDCDYCSTVKTAPVSVNIDSLINTLDNSGKVFKISFSGGGEPFTVHNLVEACSEITKNHYISLVTNLTSPKVKDFAKIIDPSRVVEVVVSAHVYELRKKELLDQFFSNLGLLREKGFNFSVQAVAYPKVIEIVDEFRELFSEKGFELNFRPFLGQYDGKNYPSSYLKDELKKFGISKEECFESLQKGNLCNAGYNAVVAYPNGDVYPCESFKNKLGNLYSEINFETKLVSCPFDYCGCPLNHYDRTLFSDALINSNHKLREVNGLTLIINYIKRKLTAVKKFNK